MNIQVRFSGIAECRLEALAPEMPPHFDLTPDSLQAVAATVARE